MRYSVAIQVPIPRVERGRVLVIQLIRSAWLVVQATYAAFIAEARPAIDLLLIEQTQIADSIIVKQPNLCNRYIGHAFNN